MWRWIFWWGLSSVCLLYAGYALYAGGMELLLLLRGEVLIHGNPFWFVIHALSGGIALIAGPLQFNPWLRHRYMNVHRLTGYTYVTGVWLSSFSALILLIDFEVTFISKVVFAVLALLWFGTMTISLVLIKKGKVKQHQHWIIRSFALSLFFVSFSIWVPLTMARLPEVFAYPLGIFLSWAGNLVLAEFWIKLTGATTPDLIQTPKSGRF